MKKIIIVGISILCILAALLFMAQSCGEGGYPSYVGDWSAIIDMGEGGRMKIDFSFTENSWQASMYEEELILKGDSKGWLLLMEIRGALDVSGDTMTMTVTGSRVQGEGGLTPWLSWDYPSYFGYYFVESLYFIFSNPYWAEDAIFHYYSTQSYPRIDGYFAVSASGKYLFLSTEGWGADYYYEYFTEGTEHADEQGMRFTRQ